MAENPLRAYLRKRREQRIAKVIAALRDSERGYEYPYDLWQKTGLRLGAMYPALIHLEHVMGWVDSEFHENGRRAYWLTADGLAAVSRGGIVKDAAAIQARWLASRG